MYLCISQPLNLLKKLKKILLLSDTHSHIDDTILKYVAQADEVWHAGDIGDLIVTDTIKKMEIQHKELMLINQQLVDELQKFKQLNGKNS